MLPTESVCCPYCGQSFEVAVDVSLEGDQRFVTDCEVCCRPMEITLQCEGGCVLELTVSGDS
jgi:transposase-like protein